MDACPHCKKYHRSAEVCDEYIISIAAEESWRKYVTERGGPYGPSSTYDNGFFDGVKWARDLDKDGNEA